MGAKVGTITRVDATLNSFIVEGTITVSGSYPAAGHGDVLSFAGFDQIKSSQPPTFVSIQEQPAAGSAISGLIYGFGKGTTQANGKMIVMLPGGGVTPAGSIAIPVDTNVGTTSPVYAGNVANHFSTTGAATSITNAVFTGTASGGAVATELGNVTYASVAAANIVFRAEFSKFAS